MSTDQPIQSGHHQDHEHNRSKSSDRERQYSGDIEQVNGHELIAIDEWLPGTEPTPYEVDLTEGIEYRTRYWCCRNCGNERNHRDHFRTPCENPHPPTSFEVSDYFLEEPRTRRALSERIDVRFGRLGPIYDVSSESGNAYIVDIEAGTCTCPDFEQRQPDGGCKHLRRVDIEIRTGMILTPDGTFSY